MWIGRGRSRDELISVGYERVMGKNTTSRLTAVPEGNSPDFLEMVWLKFVSWKLMK